MRGRNVAMNDEGNVFWPGQKPVVIFNVEQLRALSSVKCAAVFWAYSEQYPMSVKDVGLITGLTPQGVRYHTNTLLKVGLLLAVETRKSYARIQEAYVTTGMISHVAPPPVSEEELAIKRRAFQAYWRQFERDRAATNVLENVDPSLGPRSIFGRVMLQLRREVFDEFAKECVALHYKYAALETPEDPEAIRYTLLHFGCPAFGESAKEFERLTGKKLRVNHAGTDDDDA